MLNLYYDLSEIAPAVRRFALILLIIAAAALNASAQFAMREYRDKAKKVTEYARPGKMYGTDTTLIILGDCYTFYKDNKCEAKLRTEEYFKHLFMGERARMGDALGDKLNFHYSVNHEYSAYDMPIADNYALRLTYKDKNSNLVSAVSKSTLLFVKSRKSGKIALFLRLSFVPDHNDWVAALSNKGARDYFEFYIQVDGNQRKVCYPSGSDAWTDLWFERAESSSAFVKKPAPTRFHTQCQGNIKSLITEVELRRNACTMLDVDCDNIADWIIVDEPGL